MTTLHTIGSALGAVAAITATGSATAVPASAAVEPPSYTHVAATYAFNSGYYTGGYVDCPTGKLPIASGSTNSDPKGMLLSGNTTTAGTGSFASGQSAAGPGYEVEVRSHCVDAGRLSGFTRASLAVRDHRGSWGYYVKKATCPEGTVAYGGGANVTTRGLYDVDGLYTYATKPDGRSWTYAGTGALGDRTLLVESKCLPRTKLGRIATVTETVTGPDSTGRHPVFAHARCPAGFSAFAGGAFFHQIGSTTPTWDGYLRSNMMAPDDRGWFVLGDTFKPKTQLTVKVRCTDRLG